MLLRIDPHATALSASATATEPAPAGVASPERKSGERRDSSAVIAMGMQATIRADMRAWDVFTSSLRRSSMRSPTEREASASSSPNGAPVRCETFRASTTRSSPGARRRPSIASRASTAGTPQSTANDTRMNSVRTGSSAWLPT